MHPLPRYFAVLCTKLASLALLVPCLSANAAEGFSSIQLPNTTLQFTAPIHLSSYNPAPETLTYIFLRTDSKTGFQTNVNVQYQPFKGSLDDYSALSLSQFKSMGLTTMPPTHGSSGSFSYIQYDYTGEMAGRSMHWLARAFKVSDSIVLVTCTAQASTWEVDEALCTSAIQSIALTPR